MIHLPKLLTITLLLLTQNPSLSPSFSSSSIYATASLLNDEPKSNSKSKSSSTTSKDRTFRNDRKRKTSGPHDSASSNNDWLDRLRRAAMGVDEEEEEDSMVWESEGGGTNGSNEGIAGYLQAIWLQVRTIDR